MGTKELFVFYRRIDGHVSGSLQATEGPEIDAVAAINEFLRSWCGRECDTAHGLPVFTRIPFVKGDPRVPILNELPAALRRRGFVVHLRDVSVRDGEE